MLEQVHFENISGSMRKMVIRNGQQAFTKGTQLTNLIVSHMQRYKQVFVL